jgi:hypothetical protein
MTEKWEEMGKKYDRAYSRLRKADKGKFLRKLFNGYAEGMIRANCRV